VDGRFWNPCAGPSVFMLCKSGLFCCIQTSPFSILNEITQNGYDLKIAYVKNCGNENAVIRLINSTVRMDNDCNIFVSACSTITPYNSAKVKFVLNIVNLYIDLLFR
jgi:Na+-transporting NADH:ubiquinone oxidoreductase subunit NqrA